MLAENRVSLYDGDAKHGVSYKLLNVKSVCAIDVKIDLLFLLNWLSNIIIDRTLNNNPCFESRQT